MDERQAVGLLKKCSKGDEKAFQLVLSHSKAVQKVALDLAKDIPGIDIGLVKAGSLLHDIGRFDFPPGKDSVKHGLRGGEILRKEGFPGLAGIAERHIGFGISKEEIIRQDLDLPKKDFIPETKEEKVVACADNMVFGSRIGTIEEAVERYDKELGPGYGKKVKDLYDEIMRLKKR